MTKTPTRKRKMAAAPAETTAPSMSLRPDTKKSRLNVRLENRLSVDVPILSTELSGLPAAGG